MSVYTVLTDLAACLCAELTPEGADAPNLCFCGVIAGDLPYDAMGVGCDGNPYEDDNCGQAWVRLVNAYPSTQVGVADVEPRNCANAVGFDVEIGVVRCFPIEERGGAVSDIEMLSAVQQQVEDMYAMQRAILCCGALEDYVLGQYLPSGPEGGLVGGVWTLSVIDL